MDAVETAALETNLAVGDGRLYVGRAVDSVVSGKLALFLLVYMLACRGDLVGD